MDWRLRLARALALVSVAWCVVVGWHTWITPIRYTQLNHGVFTFREWAFSEISYLGPVPLLAPVVLAAVTVRGVWRCDITLAGSAAFILAAFSVAFAFSISGWYVPAAGLSMAAFGLLASVSRAAPAARRRPRPKSPWK